MEMLPCGTTKYNRSTRATQLMDYSLLGFVWTLNFHWASQGNASAVFLSKSSKNNSTLPLFNVLFRKQAGTVFPINILCGTIWVFLTVIDQPCIPSSVFSHINTQVVSFEAQEINVRALGRIIFVLIFPLGTRSPENSTMYSPLKHSSIWKSLIFSLISEWMDEWKPF